MSTVESAVTTVAVEVAVLLLVVMAVQWFLKHRSHRRELTAMQRLVEDLKSGDEERQAHLQGFLVERLKLDPEQAPEAAAALAQQESTFYRYLVRTYLGRDHEALGRLRQNLGAVLGRYQELLTEAAVSRSTLDEAQAEGERLREELQSVDHERGVLAAEKARLEEQLSITLNTVNQMLDEYSNLFGSDELPTKRLPPDSVLERVLTAIDVESAGTGGAKGASG